MMNRLLCAILLLLMISTIAAQDATPFPVLDEAAIFADGVTVIERLLPLQIDNETKTVNYYNPTIDEWENYDFPTGAERLLSQEHKDGTYLIIEYLNDSSFPLPYVGDKHVWIFSPQTGLFEPIEQVCNLMKAAPNEGQWYITRIENGFYLCHNGTGQISPSIISRYYEITERSDCMMRERLSPSPNGEWVMFHNCYEQEHLYGTQAYFVFAYNTKTNNTIPVGLTDYGRSAYPVMWLNNKVIYATVSDGFDDVIAREHFVGTVDEAIQAEIIFYEITLNDSPTMRRLFDINAARYYGVRNGFMWIEQDTIPHPIYHYDFITKEQKLIATLETCALVECYIHWNNENTLGIVGDPLEYPAPAPLYIYDKYTEAWVYENDASEIFLIQDNTILMYSFEDYPTTYLQSLDLITFEITILGTVSRSMVSAFSFLSLDKRYIIVSSWNDEIRMGIYDIENDIVYPLLRDTAYPERRRAHYQVSWQDDNSLIVELRDDYYNGNLIGRWRVRVDAIDEDNS